VETDLGKGTGLGSVDRLVDWTQVEALVPKMVV